MLYETFKLALQAISRNAMRSFLTVLGIIIGVGAVIAMVTIGNGTTAKVNADIAKLGSNMLFVRPGQFGPGRASSEAPSFDMAVVNAIREQVSGLKAVAPSSSSSATVVYGSESRSSQITGTSAEFLVARDWPIVEGRSFNAGEMSGGRAVCIIGETVHEKLFGSASPVGETIRVGTIPCEVIGLLEAKGQSGFGQDQDDVILMPLRTFQRRIAGDSDVGSIILSANDGVDTERVQAATELLLRERRKIGRGEEDDFSVHDMKEIAEAQTSTTSILTGLLGAVAGVSLLVGGIGIMNIMLVSVTERTREIGIRLAIGALERQVLMQFLVEAVVLSLFGGVVGILVGLGLAWLASGALGVPFTIDLTIVAISFLVSAVIGIVFGYFPARRAARLDPIEALRHE
jgi:putative ABC transport system permease protein